MRYDFENITILIAEDEKCNQFFFRSIFKPTKANIIIAEDGKEALYYIENIPDIGIGILDIKMPVIDGLKAARIIKNKFKNLPLIAQTDYSDNDERDIVFEAGFDGFISKPINRDELFELIQSCKLKQKSFEYSVLSS